MLATSGDEELIGGIGKVSSVGFVVECECEDVAQKVGTTILFRHVHSGDIKAVSGKVLAAHNLPADHLYSPCTAQPECLPTAEPCTQKKKHRILLQCHSLANVLYCIYHAI